MSRPNLVYYRVSGAGVLRRSIGLLRRVAPAPIERAIFADLTCERHALLPFSRIGLTPTI
jgi:hypothetical protein